MAALAFPSGGLGSGLRLEGGRGLYGDRSQAQGDHVQITSCFPSMPLCGSGPSRCFGELGRKRKCRRRTVTRSFLNQFPPSDDAEAGLNLGQSLDKVGSVARVAASSVQENVLQASKLVLDSTVTSLKQIVSDVGSVQLPAEAVKSLDAGKEIGRPLNQVQDLFSELSANASSSSVGSTISRSVEAVRDALQDRGPILQREIDQIGQSNAVAVEKATAIWESISASDSVQLLARSPDTFLETAKRIGPSVRSSIGASPSLQHLAHSATTVLHQAQVLTSSLGSQAADVSNTVASGSPFSVLASIDRLGSSAGNMFGGIATAVGGPFVVAASSSTTLLAATAGSVAVVASASLVGRSRNFIEGEDLPLSYSSEAIGAYFLRRPIDVVSRAVTIALRCSVLAASILLDMSAGKYKENERLRATQLVELIAKLGPTAIKIGQALSIRPDILPVTYLEELQKLQDKVPPFPTVEARRLILEGLGKPAEDIFEDISSEPIAAASLGQVYKARLRETGQVVAVKVQRPGVLEGISRDLFILRTFSSLLQGLPIVQSDLVALLDTWAVRFFEELDYVQEAKNAQRFAEDMNELANVTVPEPYLSYTSRKVLTSQWVEGEKLSDSNAADLLPLVTLALNCYLIQLLETGFLHADPHPGNLLRTPDGRLCVLDFGLMTEVTEDQRYTLIEYISHLVNSDFARVADDLVRLGFVPPEYVDPVKTAAVVPQLSRVLGQLVQGGGARKVNVGQVIDDLAKISEDYVFVIPPYFALILRAFSVLEGIGLEADPDYTIVDECYPYLSKRMITDDSPRTREALKYFLYGGKDQLDVERVEDLAGGFQTFRDLMAPVGGLEVQKARPSIDASTKQVLLLLFAKEGSYVQELILTELVRSVDALSREALAAFWQYLAVRLRLPVPAALAVPGSWPLLLPGLVFGSSSVARLSNEDQKSLDTVRRLWAMVEPTFNQSTSTADILEMAQDVMPFMRDLFPGVTTAAQRFIIMLLQRQALRLADDLDGRNSVTEWNRDPAALARTIQPISFF